MIATLKLKAVSHPISEALIGFRIQAAIPNKAGRGFKGQPVTSYQKPYLITQTSDYSEGYLSENFDKVVAKVKADLLWAGYEDGAFENAVKI